MAGPSRDYIAEAVESFEPRFREAFLKAVDDLRAGADLQAVIAALERGDIPGAIRAMNLDAAAFTGLDSLMVEAFRTAGMQTIAVAVPKSAQLVIRFDGRNERAEHWLAQHSSQRITAIVDDQRAAIRLSLERGMEAGQNPRTVALDIVGRMNNAAGKREGGVIGLTAQQAEFAANAAAELRSGDPAQLRAYLQRARRDKRFDPLVQRAIREGTAVPGNDVARMVQRYKDRLLALRGENIARTEAMASLGQGQDEALQQVVDSRKVEGSRVTRIWRSARDSRVRHTHAVMDGQVRRLDEMFDSPRGARLRYPGDPNAPTGEIINCRCWAEPKIDFLKGLT